MYRQLLFVLILSSMGLAAHAQTSTAEQPAEPNVTAEVSVDGAKAGEVKPAEEAVAKAQEPQKGENAETKTEANPSESKEVDRALEKDVQAATTPEETKEEFVTPRESVQEEAPAPVKKNLVVYQPKNRRDPTLSPDDFLLLQYREQQRLAAIEAERQRKLEEERRKREEEERLRQLELARIKDPTREVRNRIKIGGIVGQEVFIGDKVYTVGNKIFGARIVEVTPDSVVFLYKGHKFVRKMQ